VDEYEVANEVTYVKMLVDSRIMADEQQIEPGERKMPDLTRDMGCPAVMDNISGQTCERPLHNEP
jgi:hypothetical protein